MSVHNILGGGGGGSRFVASILSAVKFPLKEKPKQMEALAEKSGLAYIPLFSPAKGRSSHRHRSESLSSDSSHYSIHRGRSSSQQRNLKCCHTSSRCYRASSVCNHSSCSPSDYCGRSFRSSSVHRGRSSSFCRGRSSSIRRSRFSSIHRGSSSSIRRSQFSSVHRGRSSSIHRGSPSFRHGRSSKHHGSSCIHCGRSSSVHRGLSSRSSVHRGRSTQRRTIRLGHSQRHGSSSTRYHHISSHQHRHPSSRHQRSSSIQRGHNPSGSLSYTCRHSSSSPCYLSTLLTPPVEDKISKTQPKKSCGRILTSLENMKAIEEKSKTRRKNLDRRKNVSGNL